MATGMEMVWGVCVCFERELWEHYRDAADPVSAIVADLLADGWDVTTGAAMAKPEARTLAERLWALAVDARQPTDGPRDMMGA